MSNSKTPVVLVISTGAQDIKFWMVKTKNGQTELDQLPLTGPRCRALHEYLWSNPMDPGTFRAIIEREIDPNAADLTPRRVEDLATDTDWKPVFDGHKYKNDTFLFRNGKVVMQPSKTMNLAAAIQGGIARDIDVWRVLVLYSEREHLPREPIRNGPALGHWLGRELNLSVIGERKFAGEEKGIRWVNYLSGLRLYEGVVDTVNYPLHTKAAHSIERAIANAAEGVTCPFALYSSRGGFDDIKPVVAGACALHFDGRAFCFWETEKAKKPREIKPIDHARLSNESRFAIPADALPARALTLGRLHEGDILGAWGAVAHLDSIRKDRVWLDSIKDLAGFFRGEAPSAWVHSAIFGNSQSSIPGLDSLFVRAFQVEAALQGERETDGRVLDALSGTTAFAELAMELGVLRAALVVGIPIDLPAQTLGKDAIVSQQVALRREIESTDEWKTSDWFPNLFLDDGHISTMGARHAWRIWLSSRKQDSAAVDLAVALERLERFLSKRSIRYYRNLLAHKTLSETEASKVLMKARSTLTSGTTGLTLGPLWRPSGKAELGAMFLSSELVKPVFAAFGIPDPEVRYRNLMTAAMNALRAPLKVTE